MSEMDNKFAYMKPLQDLINHIKDNKKKIILVGTVLIAVTALAFAKNILEYRQQYVFEDGNLVGLKEDSGLASVIIDYTEEGKSVEKNEVIDTSKIKKEKSKEKPKAKQESLNTSKLINHIKTSKDLRENGYIILPKSFEKSSGINWSAPFDYSFIWILGMVPLYIILDYRKKFEAIEKQKKNFKASITRHLPSFSDNVVLLLESGLIFEDAFHRIASSYEAKEEKDCFEQMIVDILNECKITKEEYAVAMNRYASKVQVREYSRICNTLVENQKKGTDLVEKLRYESSGLWDARKKIAAEKGKIAETRLSFPLSLLLLALILITATPAFMQM